MSSLRVDPASQMIRLNIYQPRKTAGGGTDVAHAHYPRVSGEMREKGISPFEICKERLNPLKRSRNLELIARTAILTLISL